MKWLHNAKFLDCENPRTFEQNIVELNFSRLTITAAVLWEGSTWNSLVMRITFAAEKDIYCRVLLQTKALSLKQTYFHLQFLLDSMDLMDYIQMKWIMILQFTAWYKSPKSLYDSNLLKKPLCNHVAVPATTFQKDTGCHTVNLFGILMI